MRSKTVLTVVVIASLLVVGASGGALAHNQGASGSCDGDDSTAGDSEVGVSNSGDVDAEESDVRGIANGAQYAALNQGCDSDGDTDYVEVHSSGSSPAGEGTIQVCVSSQHDDGDETAGQGPVAVTVNQDPGTAACPFHPNEG